MAVPVPLASKSDPARSGTVGSERLVNCFAEKSPDGAKSPYAIYRAPGMNDFSLLSSEICRLMFPIMDGASEELFAVMGNSPYSVDDDGNATLLSGTVPGSHALCAARNLASPVQTLIVHDSGMSKLESGAVTTFTDGDLPSAAPNSICDVAQRFVLGYDDGRVFYSDVNSTAFDALGFFTCEGDPDGLKRVFKYRNELYCFGFRTIEVRKATADSDAPFARISGADIPVGICGKYAITELAGVLYFVDHDLIVRQMAQGYNAVPVSQHGVQDALRQFIQDGSGRDDVFLWGFVYGSHQFLVVWTPSFAWIYDATEQRWHERRSWKRQTWQARLHAYCFGKDIVSSDIGGNMYELSEDAFHEAGDPLVVELVTPPVSGFPYGAILPTVDLDVECGTGAAGGEPDEDREPQVLFSISRDGGKTFGAERPRSLGRRGQYRKQVRWHMNGRAGREGVMFRFTCSARVKLAFIRCMLSGAERRAA